MVILKHTCVMNHGIYFLSSIVKCNSLGSVLEILTRLFLWKKNWGVQIERKIRWKGFVMQSTHVDSKIWVTVDLTILGVI